MIRYNYNRQVAPPAPFVHVSIQHPTAETAVSDLPAQLDTAADMTVVPWRIVDELGLVKFRDVPAEGLGGYLLLAPAFLVRLSLGDMAPLALAVLGDKNEPHVLLGRDVLNHHRITLDGPELTLEIG